MFTFDILPFINSKGKTPPQHTNKPNVNIASDIIQALRNTTTLSCTLTFIRISFFGDPCAPACRNGPDRRINLFNWRFKNLILNY